MRVSKYVHFEKLVTSEKTRLVQPTKLCGGRSQRGTHLTVIKERVSCKKCKELLGV